jgi:hypothetical protein
MWPLGRAGFRSPLGHVVYAIFITISQFLYALSPKRGGGDTVASLPPSI